jgi:hypothetical protein
MYIDLIQKYHLFLILDDSTYSYLWRKLLDNTMGYAGIEDGPEFENVLASSRIFFDSLNFSRNILRGI